MVNWIPSSESFALFQWIDKGDEKSRIHSIQPRIVFYCKKEPKQ